jgi:antitoxin HicB
LEKILEERLVGYDRLSDQIQQRGLQNEVSIQAWKRIISSQIRHEMVVKKISKSELCLKMQTSRPQLERILDDREENISLRTLVRAASALGKSVRVELV